MNEDGKNENGLGQNHQQPVVNERLQNATRRGLNAATGGAWNKVRNAPIVGAKAQNLENKIADRLGNSKVGKKVSEHKRPNLGVKPPEDKAKENDPLNNTNNSTNKTKKTSKDPGSQKLQQSLGNRMGNLWNQIRKKKKGNAGSSDNENQESNEENKENEETEGEGQQQDSLLSQKEKKRIKRRIIIKVVLFLAPVFLIFILIVMVASILTQSVVISAPVAASKSYGTKEFEAITDKESKLYDNEKKYYEKLKEVEKKSDEVNVDYLNAILLYQAMNVMTDEELIDSDGIDYTKMTDNIDKFVDIIKESDSTDYEVGGTIFNDLKNNDDFKEYYKEIIDTRVEEELKNNPQNRRAQIEDGIIEDILTEVFDLAEELGASEPIDDTAITKETKVTVPSQTSTKSEPKTKTLTINEYIADSTYATTDVSNAEVVKAYTILYSTNIVADNKKLSISSSNAIANNALCSIKDGCSYDSNNKLVSGGGSQSTLNKTYYKGKYYYKTPLSSEEQTELNKNINSVFGNVLVSTDGSYPNLDWSKLGGLGDGDYKTILKEAYGSDYNYKNVGENSYILDGSYGTRQVKTPVITYDQKDYPNVKFCGLRNSTIAGSGCGVTSMAMVASTYKGGKSYDPIYMNNEAKRLGLCSYSGTYQSFFGQEAKRLGLKYVTGSKYSKSFLNLVLKHLSQGHLVVIRVGAGHFTGGGHYMVLGGVDPQTKKVYVYDSNNRSNKAWRKSGSGWYSFNDIIVKETYNFYIIWR